MEFIENKNIQFDQNGKSIPEDKMIEIIKNMNNKKKSK